MLQRFVDFIVKNHLFDTSAPVLVAVSGGVDSVTLCELMAQAHFPFAMAHCNFHLRPGDCDRDEAFVRHLADHYGVRCDVAQFDTLAYKAKTGQSVEEAARTLRYDFFARLVVTLHYGCLLTAHHRDDAAETFFLNLLRGTGVAGLHGIRPLRSLTVAALDDTQPWPPFAVARPLLPFGRDEIEHFAQQHHLRHVDDATNNSLLYRRNQVRHLLLPLLRQITPSADQAVADTISHLADTEQLCQWAVEDFRSRLFHEQDGVLVCDITPLLDIVPRHALLFELLRPYGFNAAQVSHILDGVASTESRQFYSVSHRMVQKLCLLSIVPYASFSDDDAPVLRYDTFDRSSLATLKVSSKEALFDADRLLLPLRLRRWRKGDRFKPYGMQGSRLVSDLFSDMKLSVLDKQRQWLLVDAADNVLWVVGLRADGRYAVVLQTHRVLSVSLA